MEAASAIELDAGAEVIDGRDHRPILREFVDGRRSGAVGIEMRILGAEDPCIHGVRDADACDPCILDERFFNDLILVGSVKGVVVVFEDATDLEAAERDVETSLVELLLPAVRSGNPLDVALKRSATTPGHAPAVPFEGVGGIE